VGIADFCRPVVGIVGDAAVFVGGDLVAFHDPFDGAFAVDDVDVGFGRYVFDGDLAVVNNGIFTIFIRETHLLNPVIDAIHFITRKPFCYFVRGEVLSSGSVLTSSNVKHFGVGLTDWLTVFGVMLIRYLSTILILKFGARACFVPEFGDVLKLFLKWLAEGIIIRSIFAIAT
jgi:hypothetical protein